MGRHSALDSARPSTANCINDMGERSEHIVAISQGKAFTKTIQHLNIYTPRTVLIAEPTGPFGGARRLQAEPNNLIDRIESEFGIFCEPQARIHWNADHGLDLIKRLAIDDDQKTPTIVTVSEKQVFGVHLVI
ncbi:MutS protein msh4 [Cryptotrichosporon argae]